MGRDDAVRQVAVVLRVPGRLDLAGGRRLAEQLRALPVDGRDIELELPDADELPVTGLAACVLTARRLRPQGGRLRIRAGAGVAASVARARLSWLLPVTSPTHLAAAGPAPRESGASCSP